MHSQAHCFSNSGQNINDIDWIISMDCFALPASVGHQSAVDVFNKSSNMYIE